MAGKKRMIQVVTLCLALVFCAALARGEFILGDMMPAAQSDAKTPEADVGDGETDLPVLSSTISEAWPRKIVITVGGDTTLGGTDAQRQSPDGFVAKVEQEGLAWPFSGVSELLRNDDLTLINFEGTLTESTNKVDKKFNFKAPAEYAEILALASVEAVNLANNHTGDYGDEGRTDTMAALDMFGITYCGPKAPVIYETRGVKIGLIGNTFPYTNGKRDISQDVKSLREQGCQIVIASFHWGSEYDYAFTRDQRNIGRAAIKAGADIVVGHHPHVVQGIEKYEDTYILYSLGNFMFGGNVDPGDRDAYLARLTFTVYEDGKVDPPELQIIPILLTSQEKGTDYRPVIAEGDRYASIMKKILSRSVNMDDFTNP